MSWARWCALSDTDKARLRSEEGLSPQLRGLEGKRVEVVTDDGETRRFIVGRSSGWVPCHLEVKRRDSMGGGSAEKHYKSVRVIRDIRSSAYKN